MPFLQTLLTTLNVNFHLTEANGKPIIIDCSLSELTGTRTIASVNTKREERFLVGNKIIVVLRGCDVEEYSVNAGKTYSYANITNKILLTTYLSPKQYSTTGYFIEKYFFFSYLRLMRRENIWANSLFLVKKPL
jgi:hypothetical protein